MKETAKVLHVELSENILTVTINRPEKRNALSLDLLKELQDVFEQHYDATDLCCAILTGAGDRSFAAGGDLKELSSVRTEAQTKNMSDCGAAALDAIRYFPVSVIAALNGFALGGGAELAVACDFRVAAHTAKIGFIQGKLNITPAWGGGTDLMELLGGKDALRVLSTCEVFDASNAKALGLIDAYAEKEQSLEECVSEFIAPFLKQKPLSLRGLKAMRVELRRKYHEVLRSEERTRFVQTWMHPDHWAAAENILKKT